MDQPRGIVGALALLWKLRWRSFRVVATALQKRADTWAAEACVKLEVRPAGTAACRAHAERVLEFFLFRD